jgi:hypothetical protein
MAVIRRTNYLGQQRVDVPDMRGDDSAVAHDFDVLAGKIMGGREALVIRGLTIDTTNAVGNPPTALYLATAGALLVHYGATEAGTMLEIPDDQAADQLFSGNPLVIGSFAANATNYVGIDYIREADADTSDQTKFLAANNSQETSQSVPKAVILNYRIIISTSPFSLSTNICPVAIITTDSGGNVASIQDARNLMFRLGSGGDAPAPFGSYSWPDSTRTENSNTYTGTPPYADNPFEGGDKGINSMKAWMDAVMHLLWEAKSGDSWYSPTSREGIKAAYSPAVLGSGTNWAWTGGTSTLEWAGVRIIFENSAGTYYNTVADGSAVLADGQCLYVDIVRTSAAALVATVGTLQSLPAPTVPGSRLILAWRLGSDVYVKDYPFEVGRNLAPVATTTSDGIVRLNATPGDALHPVVVAVKANGDIEVTATGGGATAIVAAGFGNGFGVFGTGGNGGLAAGVYGLGGVAGGHGVFGEGRGTSPGGEFWGPSGEAGVIGQGGNGGNGGEFLGGVGGGVMGGGPGSGIGVVGTGGSTGGIGVMGNAGGAGVLGNTTPTLAQSGVFGVGRAGGAGVEGAGGALTGPGVKGVGGVSAGGIGVDGIGTNANPGGRFASSVNTVAAIEVDGYINMQGGANPASTSGFSNYLTPKNICKAFALVEFVAGAPAISSTRGFNINSVSAAGTELTVTFASNISPVVPSVVCNSAYGAVLPVISGTTGNTIRIEFYRLNVSTAAPMSVAGAAADGLQVFIHAFGEQ